MAQVFEVEVARTARRVTLILRGHVEHDDAATAVRLCLALPANVRALAIEALEVSELAEDAGTVLVALVRTWRRVRNGDVSIRASERALSVLGGQPPNSDAAMIDSAIESAPANAALTGMYL